MELPVRNRELDLTIFMGSFQLEVSCDSMIIIFRGPKELYLKTVLFGSPYCWCYLYILLKKPLSLSKTSSGSQNGSEKRGRIKRCAKTATTHKRQSREYLPFYKTVYTVDCWENLTHKFSQILQAVVEHTKKWNGWEIESLPLQQY